MTALTETTIYRKCADVRIKPVGRSVAAFLRDKKALHVLNPTARLLLEYLEEPAPRDELVLMLLEATDGSKAEIEADLDEAIASFLEHGLIEPVP